MTISAATWQSKVWPPFPWLLHASVRGLREFALCLNWT